MYSNIEHSQSVHGRVVKCGRVSFMPDLALFGRFGGLFRKSGPTDRPAAERPVKRKFGKNKFGRSGPVPVGQKRFLNGRKRNLQKL